MRMNPKTQALVIAVILLLGCAGIPQPLQQQKESSLQRKDVDGDGTADKFTYVFPKEELEKDVFLQKTVEYAKNGEAYDGTLTLEFENTGSGEKTFTHTEKIPKSFAAHVRDLIFSVPPDRIIQEDPEVSWEVNVMGRNKAIVEIKAVVGLGVEKAKQKLAEWLDEEYEVSEEDAIAGAVMDGVGDIEFESALNKLSNQPDGKVKDMDRLILIQKYSEKFLPEDCSELKNMVYAAEACKAIVTGNYQNCLGFGTSEDAEGCKHYLFESLAIKCLEIKDTTVKDLCMYKAALKADYLKACDSIKDNEKLGLREECKAEISQDKKYCEELKDQLIKENCCRKLIADKERADCLGVEESTTTTSTTQYKKPTRLEDLQKTNSLSITVKAGGEKEETEDGVTKTKAGGEGANCATQENLTWNGRLFSGSLSWEREEAGRTIRYRQVLEGAVTEEGDKVVWLTCEWEAVDTDDPQATDTRKQGVRISNVPLEQITYTKPEFRAIIAGPEVRHYVTYGPDFYQKMTRGTKIYEYHSFKTIDWESTIYSDYRAELIVSFTTRG